MIHREAKKRFLVTNTTAKDYAQLAVQVLADKSRAELDWDSGESE